MAPSHPSIQSFYQRETTSSQLQSSSSSTFPANSRTAASSSPIKPGDGFTEEELAEATDPMTRRWNPTSEYDEMDIGALSRGPKAVMIVGRIVNFSEFVGSTANQPKARGWHNVLVRDDSGVLQVKLYFSHKPYPFRIGQLVSIWTTFISDATAIKNISKVPNAPLATSIFPGRDTSVHIMVHLKSDTGESIRTPLGCQGTKPLPGLMTLKNFVEGGHEVDDCKILVCVKSVGPRKQIPMKKTNTTNDLVEVHIYDDTATNKLCLWGILTNTGKAWIPNTTILLITNPMFKFDARGNNLGSVALTHASMIDINPRFRDAEWLTNYASNHYKRESLKQDFPAEIWDVEAAIGAQFRIVYTLADIDEVLLCNDHCGVPIYSNTPTTICKNCSRRIKLSFNPKAIGMLMDETGCIASGKLLWREEALEDLFGRRVDALVAMGGGELRLLEGRMGGLRFTFVWAWSETIGKLAILAVRE